MAHYLVVAHGIAGPEELTRCMQRLLADDAQAALTLLVTATHPLRYLVADPRRLEQQALERARQARERLQGAGVYPVRVLVGDGAGSVAVEDELRQRPDTYDAVVLCTGRPGLRAWLAGDLRTHMEQRAGLPVFHLYEGKPELWRRVPAPRMPRLSRWWEWTRLQSSAAEPAVPSRQQYVPILLLMAAYLIGGLILALTVNPGFLLNDAVALVVYTVVIGGLLVVLRYES